MTMARRWMVLPLLLAAALGTRSARAWGPEGHEAIAALAEALLDEGAKKALREILEKDQQLSDLDICGWADMVRKELKNGSWHYVDIPYDKEEYNKERDSREGANVIERIEFFVGVLKDKKIEKAERLKALKYLVHFVADMHQPLHCIARDNDQGGNKVAVTMPGKTEASNLHKVWDFDFASLALNKAVPSAYGAKMAENQVAKMDATARVKVVAGSVADWALEGHAIAKKDVYEGVKSGDTLTEAYVKNATQVVETQILHAGMRLAKLLNEALNAPEGKGEKKTE